VRQSRQTDQGITALYQVSIEAAAATVEQWYVGYEVAPAAFQSSLASLTAKAQHLPSVGNPVVALPEGCLVLLAFPNDRKLSVVTADALKEWLAGQVQTLLIDRTCGTGWRLKDANVVVLRYMPGKRLTLRCHGSLEGENGATQNFSVIVKQFRSARRAAGVYQNLHSFSNGRTVPAVRVPRALAINEHCGLVLMEDLPGHELKRALRQMDALRVMGDLGRLLAAFHQMPKRVRHRATRRNELREVAIAGRTIGAARPALRLRLRACLASLRAIEPIDTAPTVLLHGAFRLKHVFIHEGKLALLDLDGMCMGHPAYDLGNFLSSLYYLEEQERFAASERRAYIRQFLKGYAQRAASDVTPATLLWYLAAQLIHKQAAKYVTHMHEDGREKADRMLGLAEAALARRFEASPHMPLTEAWKLLP
jgi:aminoglycoside phosphotransferase (APT) family kinase protein